jgi:hypothetical protein
MWPPVLVGTHSRLQQFVPSAQPSPSSMQDPAPVEVTDAQVPAVIPAAIVQSPAQQSPGL